MDVFSYPTYLPVDPEGNFVHYVTDRPRSFDVDN